MGKREYRSIIDQISSDKPMDYVQLARDAVIGTLVAAVFSAAVGLNSGEPTDSAENTANNPNTELVSDAPAETERLAL